jgi:hypothetical protein
MVELLVKKITVVEDLLGEMIQEVVFYKTPAGYVYKTKDEAVTSIIAVSCPYGNTDECKQHRSQGFRCQDCNIGDFLRDK